MPDIINSSFDPRLPFPLDIRQQKDNLAGMYGIPLTSRWEGMLVYTRSTRQLWILKGGLDNSFWTELALTPGTGQLPNGIVQYGSAEVSGNDLLLNDEWVWRIDQAQYQSSDDTIAITPADSGDIRIDIIVGNADSEFVLVEGTAVASPGPAIPPNIPADTVPLIEVNVNDSGIVSFTEFALSAFVRFDIDDQGLTPQQRQNARSNIQSVSKDTDDTRTGNLANEGKLTVDLNESSAALPIFEAYRQGNLRHQFTGEQARIVPHLLRVGEPVSPTARGAAFKGSTNGGDPIFQIFSLNDTVVFAPRGTGGIFQNRSNAFDESVRRDELPLTFPTTVTGTGKLNNVALADGVRMIKFGSDVTEVSGIVSNGPDEKLIWIWSDNTDGLTLTEQDTDSSAANRFLRSVNVPYQTWVAVMYVGGGLNRWVNGNTGELQETDDRYFEVVDDVLTLKYILPDIAALQAFVRGDAVLAYVVESEHAGFYNYVTEANFDGTADFSEVFPAQDGGYWVKVKDGIFSDVINQIERPIDNTGWVKQYTISLPERGDVGDEDYSTDEYYDFALFKGTIYTHAVSIVRNSNSASRGERFLEEFPFQARFIGWRGHYRVDESYLYVDGKLKQSDISRDLIRIVKKSRLNYEVHVRQDRVNRVVGFETTYRKFEGATVNIDGKTAVDAAVDPPEEIVWNYENYLPYSDYAVQPQLKISNPPANPIYPVIVDGSGNYTINQWKTQEDPYTRNGIVRGTSYTGSPYGWGTATGGEVDSITQQTIGDRKFLRFKLVRNQTVSPERSELSSVSPVTPYGGANDVRWFGDYIRVNYFKDSEYGRQDETVLFQFLPEYTVVNRPPCQYLAIRSGRYVWRMASSYRGNENEPDTVKETLFDLGPVSYGSFEKWVMQCKFNYDDGFLKVWKNDVLLIDFEGPTTWDDVGGDVPYVKFGVYKALWGVIDSGYVTPTNVVEIDHMDTRLGDVDSDYESVSPFSIEDYEQLNIDINSNVSIINDLTSETAEITTADIENANITNFTMPGGLVFDNFGEETTTNVDSLLLTGTYSVLSGNPGIPIAVSGILVVGRMGSNVTQDYYTISNIRYYRTRSSGVWDDWVRVLNEEDLETADITTANITTGNITTANITTLNVGGTTTTSADSLLTSGWYDLASSNAGIPIAVSGVLNVARAGAKIQQFYTTISNLIYYRVRSSGVWSDWWQLARFTSGSSANRPSSPITGQSHFDTTLDRPIWWDGSAWIYADGTTV